MMTPQEIREILKAVNAAIRELRKEDKFIARMYQDIFAESLSKGDFKRICELYKELMVTI